MYSLNRRKSSRENVLFSETGTTATFRAYGLICIVVLGAFIFINFYRKDTGFVSELPQTEDPHQVAEATHLAPHGVPSNAIPRALSSTRLHELANQETGYGATYQTTGGNLGVPGANGGKYMLLLYFCLISIVRNRRNIFAYQAQ